MPEKVIAGDRERGDPYQLVLTWVQGMGVTNSELHVYRENENPNLGMQPVFQAAYPTELPTMIEFVDEINKYASKARRHDVDHKHQRRVVKIAESALIDIGEFLTGKTPTDTTLLAARQMAWDALDKMKAERWDPEETEEDGT